MTEAPDHLPLRWRLVVDEPSTASLFPNETVLQHHVGTGEYRGMEFFEVNAKKVINRVPAASRMPFQYTINPYRGCSHACSYCVSGDTPILMGDGRTKPIADVVKGDVIYGTQRIGTYRRYVRTEVLDHWSTIKPAWRVVLDDGTELVASEDHRFLTNRGWKHVTGAESGAARRPHLTSSNYLIGTGRFAHGPVDKMDIAGRAVKHNTKLRVVNIEPLGVEMSLHDITTGTGDFIANGVISHNCFARPTHEYLNLNTGDDFDSKIVVKVNAVERTRAEVAGRRWAGHHIAMGTNTDPYQKAEGRYHLTRGIVEALGAARNPFSILTKSTLVLRDLDVLVAAAERTDVRLNFSIGTLDRSVWKLTEPGTPPPDRRIDAVRRINEAGIPCGVLIAPILPGLSDGDEQLQAVVDACVRAGAATISAIALHLRPGVREHYLGWLAANRSDLLPLYDRLFTGRNGPRSYQPRSVQEDLSVRVQAMVRRAEGRYGGPRTVRDVHPYERVSPSPEPIPANEQLSLL